MQPPDKYITLCELMKAWNIHNELTSEQNEYRSNHSY